jgi:putative FmdB family regulatory protein
MPIYTYRCTECGVEFEQRQNFSDPPLIKCPECGKKSLRKVYSPAGIIFKGSGWYATDHRSPSGGVNIHKDKSEGSPERPEAEKPAASAPSESHKKEESLEKKGE